MSAGPFKVFHSALSTDWSMGEEKHEQSFSRPAAAKSIFPRAAQEAALADGEPPPNKMQSARC